MNEFLLYQRRIQMASACGIGAAAAGLFAFADSRAYAAGILLGGIVALVKFRLRVLAVRRMMEEGEGAAGQVRVALQSYALMAGALLLALAMRETFYVWTTFAGLFVPNLILIADGFLRPQRIAESSIDGRGEGHVE